MKPDKPLIKHTLAILNRLTCGLEEKSLMVEIEVAAGRPLTTAEAKDAIIFCTDRGWASSRVDDFSDTRYSITESGKTHLSGM